MIKGRGSTIKYNFAHRGFFYGKHEKEITYLKQEVQSYYIALPTGFSLS